MDVFVARQPIFDKREHVFAYELLYRSGHDNYYSSLDGDQASLEVITNSIITIGLNTLSRGKKVFINFTRRLLESEVATLLPRELIVVEILEDIEPDEKMIAACRNLKKLGYLIALDDFVFEEKLIPLLDVADIIKVDFLKTRAQERREIVKRTAQRDIKYLAEKVETREDFLEGLEMGYSYFQGYFFCKPVIVTGKDIPAFKLNYLKIIEEINRPEMDFDRVEQLIKWDVSLTYKLLKLINSAYFGFRSEIRSVRQALALLGQKETSKWLSLLLLKSIGGDKPDELLITALCRASFCESIAPLAGLKERASELFLMGMFSLLEAFLDRPMADILKGLSLPAEISGALLGAKNSFREVYEAVLAYEKGNWDYLSGYARRLGIDEEEMAALYLKSLQQANRIYSYS